MNELKNPITDLMSNCRAKNFPLTGYFELTPRCSLDCKMCYVHLTDEQMRERGCTDLSTEQWIDLIDQAADAGMVFTVLTGGECMLHKGFKEIYLEMKKRNLLITINTNATLINDDYIEFFKKYPPNMIRVSIYGITDDGYERVTGRRVFSRVCENVLKLKHAGFYVKISVTVSRQLYEEAAQIVQFARENHIPYNVDMAMFDAEQETGRSRIDYDLTADEIVAKYLEIMNVEGRIPAHNDTVPEIPERISDGTVATALRCSAGRAEFCIKWNGLMQPCIMEIPNAPKVTELGFEESWKIVTQISRDFVIPVECVACKMQPVCSNCVFLRRDAKDPGHANPEICKVTAAKLKAGITKLKTE